MKQGDKTGTVFNIQKFSVHDGPGIRTTVFLKGCPLQCLWCSNAESISPEAELGFIRNLCDSCGQCIEVCPENAISFSTDGVIRFHRDKCTACGECVAVCAPSALTVYGKQITVENAFREVVRDKAFYEGGGGVTASGGEPLRQADFVADLFRMCHEAGIGTCLDTSGFAPAEKLSMVLDFADYVLYDIKLMDSDRHRQFTGQPNDLILANAEVVASSGVPILVRIPLVAGVNDTDDNVTETARFVKGLRDDIAIELLPYHRLGIGKYQTLDKPYPGEALTTPEPGRVEAVRRLFEELGVRCAIGG